MFSTKGRKCFTQHTKTLKKHIIQKIDLHKNPIVSVNAVLTTQAKLCLQSPRMIKKLILFSKNPFLFFLITMLRTRRMRWLQPRRSVFEERRKSFRSIYKKFENNIKLKKVIGINFLLSRWMQCWPPRRSFPPSLQEWYNTYFVFRKILFCFSSLRSNRHEECGDYNLAEELSTKGRKLFAQNTKMVKKHVIQKNGLHKDPIVPVNAVLTTPPKLSLQSPRSI